MASVIGDYVPGPSQFHNMIATSSLQHQPSREPPHYRSERRQSSSPRYGRSSNTPSIGSTEPAWAKEEGVQKSGTGGASRFPSPPSSSSPSTSSTPARPQYDRSLGMEGVDPQETPSAGNVPFGGEPLHQQPSPSSEAYGVDDVGPYHAAGPSSPGPRAHGQTIKVRDLSHIQSLARAGLLTGNGSVGIVNEPALPQIKYDISAMPIGDIIEMVAALLTKITQTNDLQHDAIQRNVAHQQQASQNNESSSSHMSPLSTSMLAFHGKNVPAITILSYLSRIHRYCPTTYEVFLSLLVYFDRMTERVNDLVSREEDRRRDAARDPQPRGEPAQPADTEMRDDGESDETDSELADDDDDDEMVDRSRRASHHEGDRVITASGPEPILTPPATYFVVDSFNIHRLIIAGVTCASKFFSDVFYTNSRYAKVGGLPLAELNHLELQFLLLNDFRLAVPVEDLEAYATMLVEFYGREVVAQASNSAGVPGLA